MEAKPEVVVLSAKEVDREGLRKVLAAGQDDEKYYEFRFAEGIGTKFPNELVAEINSKSVVVFVWDPQKSYTVESFKQILLQLKGKPNFILFCQTGDQAVSQKDKGLLLKWLKSAAIPEAQFFIVEAGIHSEAMQPVLLRKILERCGVQPQGQPTEQLDEASLGPTPPSKAYFEYGNTDLTRNHSRQKRADFIKANYVPDAHGVFSVDQLMQLFAIYMSVPLGSKLSKSIEKGLADALMSEVENKEYLTKADSGRSTIMGKSWDKISQKLKTLLSQKFSVIHAGQDFDRIMNILMELQNCVTSQETAWGYKVWGGQEQVELVGSTIENTMNVMMRMYPCLLKPNVTAVDLPLLKIGGLQLPTEVVDIINRVFVRVGNNLGK